MTLSINAHTSAGSDQVGSLDNSVLTTLVTKLGIFSANIANQPQPADYYMQQLSSAYGQDVSHTQSVEYRYEWDPKAKKYLRYCYEIVVSQFFGGTSNELIARFEFGTAVPVPSSPRTVVDGVVEPQ